MGNSRCDFLAMKGNEVVKVQVKTAATRHYKAKDTKYTLAVLTTTRNGVAEAYSPQEVDEFFVIGNTMAWVIPNSVVAPSKTVMLESTEPNYQPRHGWDTKAWRVSL